MQTIESCQGGNGRPVWICFIYGDCSGGHWEELAHFVLGYFGPNLARHVGDAASVSIYVSESGTIRGELSIRPEAIDTVTTAIKALAKKHL